MYAQPAWSQDGKRLAVFATTFETHEWHHVWVFDRKMRHVRTFESLYGTGGDSPSWSPDGRSLAFGDLGGGWIYVARLPTSVRAIANHFGVPPYDSGPSWSPHGDLIAFARDGILTLVKTRGGGTPHALADQVGTNPAWSPNGRSIAFDNEGRIGVLGADGRDIHYLVAHGAHPAWSPDGTMIAYQRGRDIWVINVGTRTSQVLVRNAKDPAWVTVAQ